MKKRHAKPATNKLFQLALQLRAVQADQTEIELKAMEHYPGKSSGNPSRRSMLKRLVAAPQDAFAKATRAYMASNDMHDIIKCVPKVSKR